MLVLLERRGEGFGASLFMIDILGVEGWWGGGCLLMGELKQRDRRETKKKKK